MPEIFPSQMSRRRFLTLAGGTLSLLALPRCSRGGLTAAPSGDAGDSTHQLKMLSWPLYIDVDAPGDPGSVARFSSETGTGHDLLGGLPRQRLRAGPGVRAQAVRGQGHRLRHHRPHLLAGGRPAVPGPAQRDPPRAGAQPRQPRPHPAGHGLGPGGPLPPAVAGRLHRDHLQPRPHRPRPALLRRPARPRVQGPGGDGVGDAGGPRVLHAGQRRRPQPGHRGLGQRRPRPAGGGGGVGPGHPVHRQRVRRRHQERRVRGLPVVVGRGHRPGGGAARPALRHPRRGRHAVVRLHGDPQGGRERGRRRRLDELRLRPGQRGQDHRRRGLRQPGDGREGGPAGRGRAPRPSWPPARCCSPTTTPSAGCYFWSGTTPAEEAVLQERFSAITAG